MASATHRPHAARREAPRPPCFPFGWSLPEAGGSLWASLGSPPSLCPVPIPDPDSRSRFPIPVPAAVERQQELKVLLKRWETEFLGERRRKPSQMLLRAAAGISSLFFGISLDSEFPWNSPLVVPHPGGEERKNSITHKGSCKSSPPESMDSLVLLCARRVVAQCSPPAVHALRNLPPDLYPLLFQLAFLHGKPLVLRVLVAFWPFPELHFQRLVRDWKLLPDHTCMDCIQAVIEGVVEQLQRVLREPGCHSSLRMLDMTGLPDSVSSRTLSGFSIWSTTRALARACVEMSKHQQEFQRHRGRSRGRSKGRLRPLGMDVRADLCVDILSYGILHNALHATAAVPLRLKCRIFKAKDILAFEIVTLLESLDPSCVRRVDLCFKSLGLTEFSKILLQLSRFPELRSLKLHNSNVDVQHPMLESAIITPLLAWRQGILPSLPELSLGSSRLSGILRQIRCFHAPALKSLDVNGLDVSKGFLEPLQLLLEETSASLLHLDLRDCRMANAHLDALLPALLRCSHLRFLGLHGNHLSTVALKNLLQKIVELPDLHLVVYPFPVDCYKLDRLESGFDFVTDEELLAAATAEFFQILENSRRTDLDWTYNPDSHDVLDYFSL
ncbi:leucine-rich repeat-containing protein 14-like [Oenanthe melanoleuca]|uniref:leucine-rich repeat-containing protein 14-like n=1 Tax=Oenanthe melanoleuca TaxID=2939378 RepID=UPI0024C1A9BE|nr:leucine-rich repeat-containing protein 14-like [Oenanthe melanoleuca]